MIQTADYDHNHFRNPYAGDDVLPVQFYMGAFQNDAKTEAEGRPIFDEVEHIKILVSKDQIVERPVQERDKIRWPRQYAAWKNTGANEPGMTGTPLNMFPQISPATIEELRYFKIFTIEQLAEVSDANAQKVNGIQRLKQQAAAYIMLAKEQAPLQRLNDELAIRDSRIESQDAEIAALKQQMNDFLTRQAQPDTIKPQARR